MFDVSPLSRRRRSVPIPVKVIVTLCPLLTIAALTGCSRQSGDAESRSDRSAELVDRFSDRVRLVQSGDAPPIEVVPTPPPDGAAETDPPAPAAPGGEKITSPRSPTPEMVPAPEGIPEAAPDVDPAMDKQAAMKLGSNPRVDPVMSVKDAIKRDAAAGLARESDLGLDGPEDYRTWPVPNVAIVVTGQQHGYIEPCGCTGLDRQKGGVARRFTFMKELRSRGWQLVPVDAGNQVRRYGPQSAIKFQRTAEALKSMDYQLVGLGPDDVRLASGEVLAVVLADSPETALYASANVTIVDRSLMPQQKVVTAGGMRIGLTSILDPDSLEATLSDDITVEKPIEAAHRSISEMANLSVSYRVVTFFGKEEAAAQLVREVPGFDLVIVGGGAGEPTYKPQAIPGSATQMIVTGDKAMYAGVVGLYDDQPMKYARVPLTHEFADAPEMRRLMQSYQDQLKTLGLKGLGLQPIRHPSGEEFVGTATCGECHTTAYDIWEATAHAEATEHIVQPPKERGDIARHFDPECISCHVTGWDAQGYSPYESGYLSLDQSSHLTGNGCENCHGPGASHAAAEREGSGVSEEIIKQLRLSMRLPLEKAKDRCMDCHDLDNSPDFHDGDAFEDDYWPQVEHYGVD